MEEKDFIQSWINKLQTGYLRKFPADYIEERELTESFNMPKKQIILGPEFFGAYELLYTDKHKFYQAKDLIEAKYILYGNATLPDEIEILTDNKRRERIVRDYEHHLDKLVMEIVKDFRKNFPKSKHFFEISNQIFNSLNLQRY